MMHLGQALESCDSGIRLSLPAAGNLTGETLRRWLASREVDAWRQSCAGGHVAVWLAESEHIALCLLALDGIAARIILLPTSLPEDEVVTLATRASPSHWVGPLPSAGVGGVLELPMPPLPAPLVEAPPAQRKASFVESEWVLATSGTTKFPKLVVHTLRTLSKSVRRDPGVGREFCWGLLYDLNRFAGLQVFFQAILGGSRLVLIPKRMPLEAAIDHLCQSGCNALSATPTMWRRLLMTPGSDKLALRQVTLGGEIADAAVLNALRAAYPMARVVHIYASTEAGVGFAVSDGREGFPVNYLERGVRGVELRVDAEGILQIRPAITGQKYLQEATGLAATDGYLSTGDRVEIVGDRVHFLGRDSGAINVGGNKVQPEEVERVLLSHPAVAFATVLPKQSGIMGALIEARVVLQPQALNAKNATAELREWCTSRLERYKVPAFIRIVNEVDMSETGKVSRKAL